MTSEVTDHLFDELDLNQLLKDDFFEVLTKDDSNGKFRIVKYIL